FVMQRKLQYLPDPRLVEPAEVGLDRFSSLRLDTPDGERLVAWHAPPNGGHPTIVYFQGNGLGLAARAERFRLFHQAGYGVLALGYRGYSGSTGAPSEAGLITDAVTATGFLRTKGFPPERLVYYGESLGTGVAVQLASRDDTRPAAVILEAPFTSALDVARLHYWYVPLTLLMRDQFRSVDHIAAVKAPLFVLHGDADGIVPVDHGRAMFAAAGEPKEIMEVPGGSHGTPLTPEIWSRMDAFLRRHAMQKALE
ncbi:MAG: alpha/beta hydrolase, partial [bacterium]